MASDGPRLPDVADLFDNAPCGLATTAASGTFLQVNRTLCDWLGYTADELIGHKRLQDLFNMGGRIFHQTHWLPMLQMQGSVSEVKLALVRRDGQQVPVMINARRRPESEGGVDQISIVVAEERNKYERELLLARQRADNLAIAAQGAQAALESSQSRLQQAMQSGRVFAWDVDPTTRTRRYGDEVALLLGYAEPRPVDEAMLVAAIAAEQREGEAAAFARALAHEDGVQNWAFRLHGIDGKHRAIECSGHAFFDEAGVLTQFVGILNDVTGADDARIAANDRALFAEQMVGIVSHDLRNPLSAILMGAQMLSRRADLPPDRMRILNNIGGAARRAHRLIADLLDFTVVRIGSGLTAHRSTINGREWITRTVEELALAFPGRTLEHVHRGSDDCSVDADRVAQLVGNLVANAMTYGATDQPVTVTSVIADETLQLTVHNFGQPIPSTVASTLFEPMVRGGTTDQSSRSVGLGLFIVRAIVLAHGGRIDVSSDHASGTTFDVRLPFG